MVNLSRMRTLIAYEQRLRFDRLKKLAKATKITTTITGMPRGSGTGNKIQDGAIELVEVREAYREVIDELQAAEERTKNNTTIDVVFCLNYGGRAEIADACAAIAREVRDGKISGDRVTEKMIAEHLYNPDIPDCDLVIRTSGEQRTSNFLPWEAAYAELDFVPELFPDCGREVLWRSIDHYIHRDRRFGGVKK